MKHLLLLFLWISLSSFKGKGYDHPEYAGTWRSVTTESDGRIIERIYVFKPGRKPGHYDIYRKQDPEGSPYCRVHLTDDTHFKGYSSENESALTTREHNITGYIEGHKLHLSIHDTRTRTSGNNSTVSYGDYDYTLYRWNAETSAYVDFPSFPRAGITR